MVLILSIASLALAAISAVSGRVVPRKTAPAGWNCSDLEPYNKYHERYLSFDCQDHHGTEYFDQCCHPRLANETSLPFPSQCGCDDDGDDDTSSSSNSTQTTPTPTPAYVVPTPSVSPQPEQSSDPAVAQPSDPSSSTSSTPAPSPTPSPVSDSSNTSGNSDNNNNDDTSSGDDNNNNTSGDNSTSTSSDNGSNNNNSNGDGDVHTGGEATFFYQGGAAGACGQVHSDSDFICAMDQDLFGTSGPSSPLCGKQVKITNTANGNTVTVTVADDCPTCSNSNSIDLSVAAFQALGDMSLGVLPISWQFES